MVGGTIADPAVVFDDGLLRVQAGCGAAGAQFTFASSDVTNARVRLAGARWNGTTMSPISLDLIAPTELPPATHMVLDVTYQSQEGGDTRQLHLAQYTANCTFIGQMTR